MVRVTVPVVSRTSSLLCMVEVPAHSETIVSSSSRMELREIPGPNA
ncbi:hypothetical protein ACFOPN_12665 [Xanthomonas hyacinthi]